MRDFCPHACNLSGASLSSLCAQQWQLPADTTPLSSTHLAFVPHQTSRKKAARITDTCHLDTGLLLESIPQVAAQLLQQGSRRLSAELTIALPPHHTAVMLPCLLTSWCMGSACSGTCWPHLVQGPWLR